MAHVVRIRLEPGTLETGLWCNDCMTSGGFHLPLYRLSRTGVEYIITAFGCFTCEGAGDLE